MPVKVKSKVLFNSGGGVFVPGDIWISGYLFGWWNGDSASLLVKEDFIGEFKGKVYESADGRIALISSYFATSFLNQFSDRLSGLLSSIFNYVYPKVGLFSLDCLLFS